MKHRGRHGRWVLALTIALSACAHWPAEEASADDTERIIEQTNDIEAIFKRGQAAERAGDYIRAEQYYARAEALGMPPERVLPRLLTVLVAAQRYDDALARCRRRLAQSPADRDVRRLCGLILLGLERWKEAEAELVALLRSLPDDAEAHLALGKLYRDKLGDPARARPLLERYVMLAPDSNAAATLRSELWQGRHRKTLRAEVLR